MVDTIHFPTKHIEHLDETAVIRFCRAFNNLPREIKEFISAATEVHKKVIDEHIKEYRPEHEVVSIEVLKAFGKAGRKAVDILNRCRYMERYQ